MRRFEYLTVLPPPQRIAISNGEGPRQRPNARDGLRIVGYVAFALGCIGLVHMSVLFFAKEQSPRFDGTFTTEKDVVAGLGLIFLAFVCAITARWLARR